MDKEHPNKKAKDEIKDHPHKNSHHHTNMHSKYVLCEHYYLLITGEIDVIVYVASDGCQLPAGVTKERRRDGVALVCYCQVHVHGVVGRAQQRSLLVYVKVTTSSFVVVVVVAAVAFALVVSAVVSAVVASELVADAATAFVVAFAVGAASAVEDVHERSWKRGGWVAASQVAWVVVENRRHCSHGRKSLEEDA